MVIGSVALVVIAVYATVIAVWTRKLRNRRPFGAAIPGKAPGGGLPAPDNLARSAKTLVCQSLSGEGAGADAVC